MYTFVNVNICSYFMEHDGYQPVKNITNIATVAFVAIPNATRQIRSAALQYPAYGYSTTFNNSIRWLFLIVLYTQTTESCYISPMPTITIAFSSIISFIAYRSPSRPHPLSLTPPYGCASTRRLGT